MDPEEARRGQADFVKVRDWRGGRGEVGDLEVERVVASVPGAPRGTGGAAGGPLFPELVARMRLLEAQGELGVAGEGRLPPPGEWALSGDHLADFLRGLLAVHGALTQRLRVLLPGLCACLLGSGPRSLRLGESRLSRRHAERQPERP